MTKGKSQHQLNLSGSSEYLDHIAIAKKAINLETIVIYIINMEVVS